MMLAQNQLPDPAHFSSLGWVVVSLTGLIIAIRSAIGLVNDVKGKPSLPPAEQLDQRVTVIERDVREIKEWKDLLLQKLEADKLEIVKSGEMRASSMHKRLNAIMVGLAKLQGALSHRGIHTPEINEEASEL